MGERCNLLHRCDEIRWLRRAVCCEEKERKIAAVWVHSNWEELACDCVERVVEQPGVQQVGCLSNDQDKRLHMILWSGSESSCN